MRCKEHFQGDRCRKEAHHDSDLAMKPDPIHAGQFSSWKGEGDTKVKLMQSQAPRLKRDRQLERFAANPDGFKVTDRRSVINKLREYMAYQLSNKRQSA